MEPSRLVEEFTLVALLIIFVVFLSVAWVFVWALLKAAEYPAPVTLTVSLSILTLLSIVGAIVTDSTELVTLAATGLGALAGAVSSQYDKKKPPDDPDGSPPKGP